MKIVFFDGYCSLCNGLVDWVMKRDQRSEIKFASLQGETAKRMLAQTQNRIDFDTIVYLRDGKLFERSTAILLLLEDLGGVWKTAKICLLLPTFLRDAIYKLVAANRYRLFTKRDTCRVPSPQEKDRLLP